MPIEPAQWLVEGRVIYAYAHGKVTKDDFAIHNQRMTEMIAQGQAPIHFLADAAEDFAIIHPSIKLAREMLTFIRHEALDWSVQVHRGGNSAASLAVLLAKFMRVNYRQFNAIHEALDFLRGIDDTVDWQKADLSIIHQDNVSK